MLLYTANLVKPSEKGLSRGVERAKIDFEMSFFLAYFEWLLEVVLFSVGYMANIFVSFRLVSYFVVILVILVLPMDFMFHQCSPEVSRLKSCIQKHQRSSFSEMEK